MRTSVLSIGKLAIGQERYYLEQADARIDRATSIASGVEDYYLDGSEPDGLGRRGQRSTRRVGTRWARGA